MLRLAVCWMEKKNEREFAQLLQLDWEAHVPPFLLHGVSSQRVEVAFIQHCDTPYAN